MLLLLGLLLLLSSSTDASGAEQAGSDDDEENEKNCKNDERYDCCVAELQSQAKICDDRLLQRLIRGRWVSCVRPSVS